MSETDVAVIMAKAMFPSDYPSRVIQEAVRGMAADAITALEANGYAIVPVTPTREMIIAGETAAEDIIDWTQDSHHSYRTDEASDFPVPVYRAMISIGKARA